VCERRREVPEVLAPAAEFLAVEPEVVRVAEHLLEDQARLRQIAEPRQVLDVPERAHVEGALVALQPVGEVAADAVA
jgi:hypothetical protein